MRKGFTLVEIMIVVAIIALLAAIAIPNLLRARLNANESAAIAAMQTIVTAQISWRTSNSTYCSNLFNLSNASPPYIDSVLGNGQKQGYNFAITNATSTQFVAIANPVTPGRTGNRRFCTSDEGVIRYSTNNYSNTANNCSGTVIE